MERINQLNILRESNATLRNDSQATRKRVTQLEAQVETLKSELEPVKAECRDAKAELESRDAHIQKLEAEVKHWQERCQSLMSKVSTRTYDLIHILKQSSTTAQTLPRCRRSRTRAMPCPSR